ncbi:hypothetical protein SAMN04489867_1179 [Pedococcus dokdonensis]|uniref:Fibronectin type-III domain-containing protein n=1 Tax=Pedococcus dokdonensis TaxID=443156 RepID=A0A1H0P9Q6_9MICO|nr:hypothetical protein [Pedococcus dokdonensis]SDP01389.1 hypothetical protein SAMN04489867_1179 [Pedococcus dokdonensis]
MSTNLVRRLGAVTTILLTGVLGACGTSGSEAGSPAVTAPPSTTRSTSPTASSDKPTTVPEELTAEEQLRVNPPPPQRLTAVREGTSVTLTWSPPPAVAGPHSYSDRVVEYRVFRTVDGGGEALVGTSSSLTFTDVAPGPGTLRYAVSSVREHGVEGARTDAVTAPAAS